MLIEKFFSAFLAVGPDTAPTTVRQPNLTAPCFPTSVPTLDAIDSVDILFEEYWYIVSVIAVNRKTKTNQADWREIFPSAFATAC